MYQITAVYLDSEIAYAEADGFTYAKEEVMDQVMNSMYSEVIDDVQLICLSPGGMQVTMPAVI